MESLLLIIAEQLWTWIGGAAGRKIADKLVDSLKFPISAKIENIQLDFTQTDSDSERAKDYANSLRGNLRSIFSQLSEIYEYKYNLVGLIEPDGFKKIADVVAKIENSIVDNISILSEITGKYPSVINIFGYYLFSQFTIEDERIIFKDEASALDLEFMVGTFVGRGMNTRYGLMVSARHTLLEMLGNASDAIEHNEIAISVFRKFRKFEFITSMMLNAVNMTIVTMDHIENGGKAPEIVSAHSEILNVLRRLEILKRNSLPKSTKELDVLGSLTEDIDLIINDTYKQIEQKSALRFSEKMALIKSNMGVARKKFVLLIWNLGVATIH